MTFLVIIVLKSDEPFYSSSPFTTPTLSAFQVILCPMSFAKKIRPSLECHPLDGVTPPPDTNALERTT